MKKVFMVLCTVKFQNQWRNFDMIEAFSREDAEKVIKEQMEWDEKYMNLPHNYFIIEGLAITKDKINEIVTNSNVQ